jgi:enoyl-CoA hydratase
MPYEQIIAEKRGRVGIVRLNRPDRLNAFNKQMSRELLEAVEAYNQDPDIGAIILTGEGRAFCTGMDVRVGQGAIQGLGERPPGASRPFKPENNWAYLAQHSKPIVAAINGAAVGGGATTTLSCDVRIASERAQFQERHVRLGLAPDVGASRLWVQALGLGQALRLLLTARMIDAWEAERIGLVIQVVPHDQLMDAAMAIAEEIAANPTSALLAAKQLVWTNLCEADSVEVIRRERELTRRMMQGPAFKEAAQAFLEKREPRFDRL